ncbi:phenylacetate--CoA ligase family protein [Actinomadura yumaensis]|uniref:phenylacetate--CoA ligase family protein n=1 Tax=Actinomadura yumaensis TaxID=111807 RepID=UPI00361819D6
MDRTELATYHESSGTAGRPTASYYTAADWAELAERFARKPTGIRPADTFLVRTPYALMITGHMAHAGARSQGATVVPGDNRSLAMPCSRVVRVLHDLAVTLTWSMPSETLLWAAAARAHGLDPATDFPALRALFVGGEPLGGARRRRIEEIWGSRWSRTTARRRPAAWRANASTGACICGRTVCCSRCAIPRPGGCPRKEAATWSPPRCSARRCR